MEPEEPCLIHFVHLASGTGTLCAARVLGELPRGNRGRSMSLIAVPNLIQVPSPTIVIATASDRGYQPLCIKVMWVNSSDLIAWPLPNQNFVFEDFPAIPHCRPFVAQIVYLFPHISEELTSDRACASQRVGSLLVLWP